MKKNIVLFAAFLLPFFGIAQKNLKQDNMLIINEHFSYEIAEAKIIEDTLYVLFVNPNRDGKCGYLNNKLCAYNVQNGKEYYSFEPQVYDMDTKVVRPYRGNRFEKIGNYFVFNKDRNLLISNRKGECVSSNIIHDEMKNLEVVTNYHAFPVLQTVGNEIFASLLAYSAKEEKSYVMIGNIKMTTENVRMDSIKRINFENLLLFDNKIEKGELYDALNKEYTAIDKNSKKIFVSQEFSNNIFTVQDKKVTHFYGDSLQRNDAKFVRIEPDSATLNDREKLKALPYQYAIHKKEYDYQYKSYRNMVFDEKSDRLYRTYCLPVAHNTSAQNKTVKQLYEDLLHIDDERETCLEVFDASGKVVFHGNVGKNKVLAGVYQKSVYFREKQPQKAGEFVFYQYKLKK